MSERPYYISQDGQSIKIIGRNHKNGFGKIYTSYINGTLNEVKVKPAFTAIDQKTLIPSGVGKIGDSAILQLNFIAFHTINQQVTQGGLDYRKFYNITKNLGGCPRTERLDDYTVQEYIDLNKNASRITLMFNQAIFDNDISLLEKLIKWKKKSDELGKTLESEELLKPKCLITIKAIEQLVMKKKRTPTKNEVFDQIKANPLFNNQLDPIRMMEYTLEESGFRWLKLSETPLNLSVLNNIEVDHSTT